MRWHQVQLLADGGGAISAEGQALLLEQLGEEELSVVLLLGPSATQQQRRQLVARLLAADPQELGDSSDDGGSLQAFVVDSDQDHPTLVLDADVTPHSALYPLLGVVCALSSLVVTCSTRSSDGETPLTATLAPFSSLYETLRKELPAVEVFDLLPNTITLDMASLVPSGGSYQPPRGAVNDLLLSQHMKGLLHPSQVTDLVAIQPYAPVKKLFGSHLSGESLHSLLASALSELQEQQEPDLATAWDEFAERKCQAVAEDALATYVDCTHASVHESPPMNLTTFATLHEEIWRLALDVYHSGAKLKSTRRRSVRNRLKSDLRAKYEENQEILRTNSHLFCDKLRRSLWQELSPLETTQQQQPSFDSVLRAIQQFDAEYQARASGPEKDRVLAEFYHEDAVQAFQRLESLVTEKLSAEHVQDLRERLLQDFETKKQTLVEHFKQEEAQLRACMAREMNMMQKVHHAKHARVKIDELEQRRMQTEMAQLQQLNADLKAKQIALEAAHESEVSTNTALERKIEELEGSVRAEMASRAELVDTLALTIKATEEKDSNWQSQVDLLKLEVKEKSSHIESELKDVTLQLRKTTEVRELVLAVSDLLIVLLTLLLYDCRRRRNCRRN